MGRPSKLTKETAEKIIGLIRLGNYRETAYAAAGICRHTMRVWLRRGEAGEEPYASFAKRVEEAEAGGEARHVATLFSASKDDWRAAAWILARKYSDRWGDKIQVEIQERLSEILDVVENVVGADAATRVFEEVARRARGGESGGAGEPPPRIH